MTFKTIFGRPRNAAALVLVLGAAPMAAQAEMTRYELDPEHTVVAFMVDHVGYAKVLGQFTEVSGHFMYDAETQELGEVRVSVPIASVETFIDARDQHIMSEDFLWADEQPEMVFTAEGGEPETDTTGTVTGTLGLRGAEAPLTLDVTLNKVAEYPFGHGKETVGISARGSVLRSDFGSTYALGGGIVGDQVDIIIEAEALAAE